MRRTSALIVGGGPAGAAAAIRLSRAGHQPLLVERQRTPGDALCGGFLSWATVDRLQRLGIDPAGLDAHRVDRLAVMTATGEGTATLPAPAAGLSRQALDAALLRLVLVEGGAVETGLGARLIEAGAVQLSDGNSVTGMPVMLATGKHDVRGAGRPRPGQPVVGLRWRLKAGPALVGRIAGRIELHLFRGGYAGLVMQEGGQANLCLVARDWRFAEAERSPQRLLEALAADLPALAIRLGEATAIGPPQAIANIPYGWRAKGREHPSGAWRIGDQAGVIPSLAGEGIGIALVSGAMAATALMNGVASEDFQVALARRLWRPVTMAGLLWRAADHPGFARVLPGLVGRLPWAAALAARLTRLA